MKAKLGKCHVILSSNTHRVIHFANTSVTSKSKRKITRDNFGPRARIRRAYR